MGKKLTKTEKPKIEKQEKDFVPGDETEDQFDKVVSLLSEWMKAGIVSVDIDVDGDITFRLPREMDKLLETQVPPDLSHEKVRAIVRNEIPALVDAGLRRNPEKALRMGIPEKFHERLDAMVIRSEKAVKRLVNEPLRERITLRRTTANYVIDGVESIESTYHVRGENTEKIDIPFISLELVIAKPRSGYTFSFSPREQTFIPVRKDEVKVMLDLHREDVKDLIEKLRRIEEETCGKGE